MRSIAIIVVFYYPKQYMIDQLKEYEGVNLIIVDNTGDDNSDKVNISNVTYIPLEENTGLSHALNLGIKKAIITDAKYILTLDQDSIIKRDDIINMVSFLDNHATFSIAAPTIVPYIDQREIETYRKQTSGYEKVNFAITSGSLYRKSIFEEIGGFDEKLFIEDIDVEMCLRLLNSNKSIAKLNDSVLYQRAGNSIPKRLLWKIIHPLFDAPIRGYYIFRNHRYLKKRYGNQLYCCAPRLYKAIIKTLLYEDHKVERIYYYAKGYIDGCREKMGKYGK